MAATDAMAVKALLFDVFGTVVDWRSSIVREGQALARRQGWPAERVDWGAFADAWRREGYTAAIARINRGEAPWASVDTLHRRMLDELLARYGIAGLTDAEIEHLNRAWHRLLPWPDAIPGLSRLRRRFLVAPLSNGDFALLTNMARFAALPWDCVLAAGLFGAYKPNRQVYAGPVALLGLQPHQAMMVAAHPGDLRAAAAAGLRTAYVPRPLEYGPAADPAADAPAATDRFDLTAPDFLDLAERLEGA